jgi:hypothetical protein
LTAAAREDIHLTLPAHPKCDRGGDRQCPARRDDAPGAFRHPAQEPAPAWDALEKLKTKIK